MNILIAPDKFKDAAEAGEVASFLAEGWLQVRPNDTTFLCPLADGGDGFARTMAGHTKARAVSVPVQDPLGRWISAEYYFLDKTAWLDLASASGLALLRPEERNPWQTSTTGTGQLMKAAIAEGADRLVLGIGGSATNDAGWGIASVFGARFLDQHGQELPPVGASLRLLAEVDLSGWSFPEGVVVEVANDVSNPLHGPSGAAHVFALQKGADEQMATALDAGLERFAAWWKSRSGEDLQTLPGAGAAGGAGAGLHVFFKATMAPGIQRILELPHIAEWLGSADLVLTGEGSLDSQTQLGKAVSGISGAARARGVPVIAVCGRLELSWQEMDKLGLTYATSILNKPVSLSEALENTPALLTGAGARLARLIDHFSQTT